MTECDLDVKIVRKMLCKMLGAIHRTMLPAGAAETYLQVGELSFDESLDMEVHKRIHV